MLYICQKTSSAPLLLEIPSVIYIHYICVELQRIPSIISPLPFALTVVCNIHMHSAADQMHLEN